MFDSARYSAPGVNNGGMSRSGGDSLPQFHKNKRVTAQKKKKKIKRKKKSTQLIICDHEGDDGASSLIRTRHLPLVVIICLLNYLVKSFFLFPKMGGLWIKVS